MIMGIKNICKNFINTKDKFSHQIISSLFNVSVLLISFLFLIYIESSVGFLFNIPVQKWYSLLGLFILLLESCFLNKLKNDIKPILIDFCILFFVILFSAFISLLFWDSSYDGRTYHQAGVILLRDGWNPVYDNLNLTMFKGSYFWLQHYTKFVETISANFYILYNNIELGKIVNYIATFSTLFLSIFTINCFENINKFQNLFLSIVLIINPVLIYQINTYYGDFFVYLFFINLLLLFLIKEKSIINDKLTMFLMIANVVMLSNVKLGGLYLSLLYIIFFSVYQVLKKRKSEILFSLKIICISVFLILLSGVNPYFTNIQKGHNVFYPIVGTGKIDIVTNHTPPKFDGKNIFYKLFYANFSKSSRGAKREEKVELKIPFTYVNLKNFAATDVTIGGFGDLWSGILVLCLFPLLYSKNNSKDRNSYRFIMLILWASILLNPVSWWARYAPQLWSIPVFLLLYRNNKFDVSSSIKNISFIIIFIMILNSFFVWITCNVYRFYCSHKMKEEISLIKNSKENLLIYHPDISKIADISFFQKLKENNIDYEFVTDKYYEMNKQSFDKIFHPIDEDIRYNRNSMLKQKENYD